MVPTVLLVTTLIFLMVRLIPGSMVDMIVQQMAGVGDIDIQTVEQVRHILGLDVPIQTQYGRWLGFLPQEDGNVSGAFQGNLGISMWTQKPIAPELAKRFPVSFELGILALITALIMGLPIGIYSGMRQDTAGDYVARTAAILGISVPGFWIATLIIVYPAIYFNWSPPVRYIPFTQDVMGNLGQFLLPAAILGLFTSATVMRMTRTMMLEVMRQDYIRTAWSKGLTERAVVFRHAMRNAMIPVITAAGIQIPVLIGGSIIFEQIFTLPGMGLYLIEALQRRDYNVIVTINMVIAIGVLVFNLLVDLTYAWLDPRVSYK